MRAPSFKFGGMQLVTRAIKVDAYITPPVEIYWPKQQCFFLYFTEEKVSQNIHINFFFKVPVQSTISMSYWEDVSLLLKTYAFNPEMAFSFILIKLKEHYNSDA